MRFIETPLPGIQVIELEPHRDPRGYFARTYCARTFRDAGIPFLIEQASISQNLAAGTLRGIHFQAAPHEEDKVVRCTQGSLFDVAVDLRAGSPTFGRWFGVTLSPELDRMLFIPKGCAHGFQTLADDTVVEYLISTEYRPESSRGVHCLDPDLAIAWPLPLSALSDRDASLPSLADVTRAPR